MTRSTPFYSKFAIERKPDKRVFHDNEKCPQAAEIPLKDRIEGRSNYKLCQRCAKLRESA